MRPLLKVFLCLAALAPLPSWSAFHLWVISEVYSNADGSVQYIEFTTAAGGQQFLTGQSITSSNVGNTQSRTFIFPADLPSDTANKRMLLGTSAFAALGIVAPDYVIPTGFLYPAGGSIQFTGGANLTYGALPGPAQSIDGSLAPGAPTPTNFAGKIGAISGAVAVGPNPVSISNTPINTSSPPAIVKITNIHNAPITISSVSVTGDFQIDGAACAALAAGASCQAGMHFLPTAEGLRTGTITITSDAPGSPHTAAVSATGEKSLVTHYYRSILRREPDAGGKQFWTNNAALMTSLGVNINETWFAMAQQFYFSAEYTAFNRDDNGFVTDLYVTFFNRSPDAGGLAFWTGQLAQGMPREVVLAAFEFSTEFVSFTQAIFGNTAARAEIDAVVDFYRGLLSRLPDQAGFDNWVGQFRTAQCQNASAVYAAVEAISSNFAGGAEYLGRNRSNGQYVGDLYNAFLRRGGDLNGVNFWINALATQSRDSVRQSFINSTEFQQRVANIVNQGCLP